MKTCKDCRGIHYETLPDMTFDYDNPRCLLLGNITTSMSHQACEHFEQRPLITT
jgi:hypothetical protein